MPNGSPPKAVTALCACTPDVTGQTVVSLDLLERERIEVRNLDGSRR
ncbi:MAG TPA: hypothetical protein VMH41_16565 [Mycobacteriales bacterium]|nr:hypothetical protein [Mycobacteriales bacterium]